MADSPDWTTATHEGNRRRRHEAFRALPFREKLARIEHMNRVAARFAAVRAASERLSEAHPGVPVPPPAANPATSVASNDTGHPG